MRRPDVVGFELHEFLLFGWKFGPRFGVFAFWSVQGGGYLGISAPTECDPQWARALAYLR